MSIPQSFPSAIFNTTTGHYDPGLLVMGVANQVDVNVKEGAYIVSLAGGSIQSTVVSTQFDKTNTTLANVTGLTATLLAGKKYRFTAILHCDTAAAGGGKVAISGTATATAIIYQVNLNDTANAVITGGRGTALGAAVGNHAAGATAMFIRVEGEITVNAAGTLTVQFAQNAASGTSSVLVGSTFVVSQVI